MLRILVPGEEHFDEESEEFTESEEFILELEHSLISLSKWESIHQTPFLGPGERTDAQTLSYIECMILNPIYPSNIVRRLSGDNFETINNYIQSKESATTFGEMPERKGRNEIISSELIYYWMVAFQIPFEVETWHLNRLFSLIRICNIKNQPEKKQRMSRAEIARRNRDINERRKAELGTRG